MGRSARARRVAGAWAGVLLPLLVAGPVRAQAPEPVALSLDQAVARAVATGEEVALARARVVTAGSSVATARSALLPQVGTALTFTRTFASVFQGSSFAIPDSLQFTPDPDGTLDDRIAYLETMAPIAGLGGLAQIFGNLPFGRENAYLGALTAEQVLYAGGRVRAGLAMARHGAAAAELQYDEERAQVELDVTRAYYGVLLAQAFEAIADSALAQAEAFLSQERLRHEAGRASELDVLRAEVTAATLRPQRVQATSAAELALLNLRRLVDVPAGTPLHLTTRLDLETEIPSPRQAPGVVAVRATRPAVKAMERMVAMRDEQVRIARGAFFPSVALQTTYTKQAFPGGAFDLGTDWFTDWTATVAVQVPVFNGGSRVAAMQQASAEAGAARLQLRQLEEGLELEYRSALGDRDRSWTEIGARRRTAEMAVRVHDLTVLRYERGLATHLEVADARLGLLTARTQLAQALADYFVAEAALRRSFGGSWDVASH